MNCKHRCLAPQRCLCDDRNEAAVIGIASFLTRIYSAVTLPDVPSSQKTNTESWGELPQWASTSSVFAGRNPGFAGFRARIASDQFFLQYFSPDSFQCDRKQKKKVIDGPSEAWLRSMP